ncbi:MAG: hypothetical protein WDM86_22760 [Rhizomicrobium sp.]
MTNHTPRGVAALEAVLESAQETARKSLELAQSISRKEDDAGQDLAYNRAIAFMKVSAKVGMALAKLKGEHTSNVTICRTEVHAPPARIGPPRPRAVTPQRPVESLQRADRTQQIVETWMKAHGMKDGDDWPVLYPDPEEDDADDGVPDDAGEASIGRDSAVDRTVARQGIEGQGAEGEGDTPQNFGGSNSGK